MPSLPRRPFICLLVLGFCLAFPSRPFAEPSIALSAPARPSVAEAPAAGATPLPALDQKRVHEEYLNGNFETVLARINAFRKENPDHSRGDSVFIARHLAVVLAADPKSAEAGKYWMHRLLLLSPDADLKGMYASEAIESMFAKVKAEDDARAGRPGRRKWLWVAAGGGAVAAAIALWAVFAHASEEGPAPTLVPVKI